MVVYGTLVEDVVYLVDYFLHVVFLRFNMYWRTPKHYTQNRRGKHVTEVSVIRFVIEVAMLVHVMIQQSCDCECK